jgi:hypothetical protein
MGRPGAAILIPTHDHTGTIDLAVRSALEQSVEDVEVIVIGDGVGAEMREIVGALVRQDPRVRFLDLPKGPHHGEVHRGAAIESTDAEIVCYLCDDDLLLPDHVESMRELLAEADLAHSQNGYLDLDGGWHSHLGDLASPTCRAWMLEPGNNFVSLTGTAHTVDSYRQLPHGWRTTPPDHWPDQYMWQQFLVEPWVRARTATRVTALQFPSHLGREEWSDQQRRAELEGWRAELASAAGRKRIEEAIDAATKRQAADRWVRLRNLERRAHELELQAGRSEEARRLAAAEAAALDGRLRAVESTRTWRLRARLRRVAALRRLLARESP